MRVYEINRSIIESILFLIYKVLEKYIRNKSLQLGINLHYEIDDGILKDNNDFIKVAKALNFLGIGIVPFQYMCNKRIYPNPNFKGFTDIATKNIIYINIHILGKSVQRVALYELISIIKYIYPDIYFYLQKQLSNNNDYTAFRESMINKKHIYDVNATEDEYEDETIANFYAFNIDNEKIPYAFINKLIYVNYKVELPTIPFNQQRYFDILWDVVSKVFGL